MVSSYYGKKECEKVTAFLQMMLTCMFTRTGMLNVCECVHHTFTHYCMRAQRVNSCTAFHWLPVSQCQGDRTGCVMA